MTSGFGRRLLRTDGGTLDSRSRRRMREFEDAIIFEGEVADAVRVVDDLEGFVRFVADRVRERD